MKIRLGNVANSSSTCFMLDLRTEGVADIVSAIVGAGIKEPDEYGRDSGILVGSKELTGLADILDDEWLFDISEFLRKGISSIGESAVFVRSSDEGIGGYIPDEIEDKMEKLAIYQMDYH